MRLSLLLLGALLLAAPSAPPRVVTGTIHYVPARHGLTCALFVVEDLDGHIVLTQQTALVLLEDWEITGPLGTYGTGAFAAGPRGTAGTALRAHVDDFGLAASESAALIREGCY